MRTQLTYALLTLLLLLPSRSAADSGPLGFGTAEWQQELETDRPDFTEGTQTVQSGHLQFEGGYTYVSDDDEGVEVEAHSLPELLLRVGLLDDLELRLAWEGYLRETIDEGARSERIEGVSDFSIGIKQALYPETEITPAVSLILEASIPVGDRDFSSEKFDPAAKLLLAYSLSERFSLGGNFNVAALSGADERYLETSASLALGASLTDSLGSYLEYFGNYPESEADTKEQHYLNGGLTYLLTSNLQVDVRVGSGLNGAAADVFSGVGFAWRL